MGYSSHFDPRIGECQQGGYMVAGRGYTPPEHVVEQADLSALKGVYSRHKNKSFQLMVEAIYDTGGESAVVDFLASITCARGRIAEITEKKARQLVAEKALS
jgi:hypothetical protein